MRLVENLLKYAIDDGANAAGVMLFCYHVTLSFFGECAAFS